MPKKADISRRDFVKAASVAAAGGALGAIGALAGCRQPKATVDRSAVPADNIGASVTRPSSIAFADEPKIDIEKPDCEIKYDIIDNHLHYVDFLEKSDGFGNLTRAMDLAGVSKSVVFGMGIAKQWDETMKKAPSYYLSDDCRCYYYSGTDFLLAEDLLSQPDEIRNRFFPFMCGVNCNDRYAADHIQQLLRIYPKFWCGIGEIMSRHDDLTALTYGEHPHLNHPAFLDIFDLAADEKLPVLIHHNITAQSDPVNVLYLDELEEAVAHNPKCNIIWAHLGISRRVQVLNLPKIIDDTLKAHPNLYCDISWVIYDYYFLDKNPEDFDDGADKKEWVNLFEKYPDRFMIGSDKVGHWATYPAEITKYYELLDMLKSETAAKLCRDNILKLIKTY